MLSNETTADHGPLAGIVVADFSRVLAGPLASMFLADLGATVIKIERPGQGDDTRSWGPPYIDGMSTYFASVNRNKRSVCLDLSLPDDLATAHEIVDRADVFIENFLPGKLEQFSLDARSVLRRCPGLVYCSISGFGNGAGATLPGYDFVVQAVGGLMSITGDAEGEPTKVGVALVDVITGLHATIAILAALRARDSSGRGQHVEVNLLSSLLSALVNQGTAYLNTGVSPGRMGNQHPSIAPYETLATADRPIAIAVGNDNQFHTLCGLLDRTDLSADPRFATNHSRVINRDALVAELERTLGVASSGHWTQLLQAAGIACGPVQDIAQAVELAERLGLDPVVSLAASKSGAAVQTVANPLLLHGTPVRYDRPPPELGEGNGAVRHWLDHPHGSNAEEELTEGAEPRQPS